jgi:SAM-dependent methyltransferase
VTVDPRAASGFTDAVGAYERGRPRYPTGAVEELVRGLGLNSASTVLDLAAGTGKLTRLLVTRVGRVIAVDASSTMLSELRRRLPGVEALTGTAGRIPLADRSVDATFVAEAFHWFGTAETCREIARVLVEGGALALLWNRAAWREQEHPWLDAFDALVEPHRQAAGGFPAGEDQWRVSLEETGLFGPTTRAEADHLHIISTDDFVALVASWSWIANLTDQERASVLKGTRELLADYTELTLLYRTEIYSTRLA